MLLRATGVPLSEAQEAQLIEQCEGWPAALYLAALSIRDGEELSDGPAPLHGDDRYVADYFHTEYLDRLRPGPLRFLRRTSVLDRMSGPLCDAVLDDEGSGAQLAKIERANLFLDSARQPARVVPLPPPLPGAASARARRARARARSGPPRPRRRLVRGGGRRRDRPRARPRSRRQRPSGRDPCGDRPPGLPVRPRREARGLVRALRQGRAARTAPGGGTPRLPRPRASRRPGAGRSLARRRRPRKESQPATRRKPLGRTLDRGDARVDVPAGSGPDARRRRGRPRRARAGEQLASERAPRSGGGAAAPRRERAGGRASSPRRQPARRSTTPRKRGLWRSLNARCSRRGSAIKTWPRSSRETRPRSWTAHRSRMRLRAHSSRPRPPRCFSTAAGGTRHGPAWTLRRRCCPSSPSRSPGLPSRRELSSGVASSRFETAARSRRCSARSTAFSSAPRARNAGRSRGRAPARGRCRPRAWGRRDGPDPGRVAPPSASCDSPFLPPDRGAAVRLAEHDQDPGDLRLPQARRIEPQRRGRRGSASRARRAPSRAHLGQEVAQGPNSPAGGDDFRFVAGWDECRWRDTSARSASSRSETMRISEG